MMLRIAACMSVFFFAACSTKMVELAAPIAVVSGDDNVYTLQLPVTVKATHAKPVNLRAGTRWQKIGTIDYGNVYDTKDQVVIVNSFDVHEAAIVTQDETIVGFYLKVAKTFVAADPVPINLIDTE